ncbi:MAG TPA: hypothetical protein VHE30_19345 [Polyangiaceae bacterium]|nr:hypothetical protein [Polyangiaceae bacterium]
MSAVFVVAVAALSGEPEAVAKELAPALGTTVYELRLALAAGPPVVVGFVPDEARARAQAAVFTKAGHRALAFARSDVLSSATMPVFRDFRLDPAGIVPSVERGEVMPYADVVLLARASHRRTTETVTEVSERKFRPVAAAVTGGLILSKTVKREEKVVTEAREQVLYVFSRLPGRAFLLRERGANYGGLGARLARTSLENFQVTQKLLRDACPAAAYDERLAVPKTVRGVPDGILATDVLAHVLAVDARSR